LNFFSEQLIVFVIRANHEKVFSLHKKLFETSHAKGPQDAAGGFLKNQVD
jgi:hypothetical protein